MTQLSKTYALALYSLVQEEGLEEIILEQMTALQDAFLQNPEYPMLLSTPNLSKQTRCALLDQVLGEKVHPYVRNFLKLLTEKGYVGRFLPCCRVYRALYNEAKGVLIVKAVSAAELTARQRDRLTARLEAVTGKRIQLQCKVDPAQLGGLYLNYNGKLLDGTVKSRLEAIGKRLLTEGRIWN